MPSSPKSSGSLFHRATLLVLLLLASANLYAQLPMSISLTGDAEVPPVTTSATGTGLFKVLPNHTVSGTIKTSGFVPTMAHIHEAPVGKNGPAIITLSKTGDNGFAVPASAKLTKAQYRSFIAGKLYVNVHSAEHPDGEIRAQLVDAKPMNLAR